ncbi:MAG: hypothetical protein R3B70_09660 [Polyangiaceae bacterium]
MLSRLPLSSARRALRTLLALGCLATAAVPLAGCTTTYEMDSFTVGDDGTDRAPEPISNSQFVRGVYVDVLGRAPDVYEYTFKDASGAELLAFPIQEQKNLVDVLDGMGDPAPMRAVLCAGLLGSAEVSLPEKAEVTDPAGFIRQQFRTLLGREPNTYELSAFEQAWADSEATGPRTVIRAILGSQEYQSR